MYGKFRKRAIVTCVAFVLNTRRWTHPLDPEPGRADGVSESSLIANYDRRASAFILPALGSIRFVFRITSRRGFSEEKIICP